MCYELCGPPLDGTPEDMADYEMWLDNEGPYAPVVEEEEETPKTIGEREALERFEDSLNEIYPAVSVCGYDYDAGRALRELDPTAFREEFNNWLDSEGLELE
jgi:hypothetical protein